MFERDALAEVFEQPGRFGCAAVEGGEGRLLDGGITAPGGWQAGRRVVLSLLGGFAEVELDRMQAGQRDVPTLDVYLDRTVLAAQSLQPDGQGVVSAPGAEYGFCLTQDTKLDAPGKKVLLAGPASLTAHLYQAGMALPRAVKGLLEAGFCAKEIYWGHSAAPIVLRRWDHADMDGQLAAEAAQLVGVWLRCSDEELAAYTGAWQGKGELRLHNLTTGHTFTAGRVDEDALSL